MVKVTKWLRHFFHLNNSLLLICLDIIVFTLNSYIFIGMTYQQNILFPNVKISIFSYRYFHVCIYRTDRSPQLYIITDDF